MSRANRRKTNCPYGIHYLSNVPECTSGHDMPIECQLTKKDCSCQYFSHRSDSYYLVNDQFRNCPGIAFGSRIIEVTEEEGYPMGANTKYVITGVLRNGRRSKPIYTDTPQHYNIWQGTIWEILEGGKRKMIKEIIN